MWVIFTQINQVLVVLISLVVVYLLYRNVFFATELNRQIWRKQLLQFSRWEKAKQYLMEPEAFELKFREIGYPFGINAKRYQLIRYVIFFLMFAQASANWLSESTLIWMGLPFSWLLLTSQWTPLFDIVHREFKTRRDEEKNRELYMLYSMISDEMKYSSSKRSVYHMIRKLKVHTKVIQPALNRGLSESANGTEAMIAVISQEINTSESSIICQMLMDLERTDSDQILHLLKMREDAYQAAEADKRKRKRNTLGNTLAAIAFAPLMIYLFNVLIVTMGYMNDLQSNIGFFGM